MSESLPLRPELNLLLDACRSEVKKWGGEEPGYLHLAAAIARRWPDEFSAEFGLNAKGQVEDLLKRGRIVGDEAAVSTLLGRSDGPEPISQVVKNLRDELAPFLSGHEVDRATVEPVSKDPSDESVVVLDTQLESEDGGVDVPTRSARFVDVPAGDMEVLAREDLVDEMLAHVGRRHPRVPLMTGKRGVGKSTLADALAVRITASDYQGPLSGTTIVRVRADRVLAADRANTLSRILEDIDEDALLFIDDVDVLANLGGTYPDINILLLLHAAVRSGRRMILTGDVKVASRIDVHDGSLWSDLDVCVVHELPRPALQAVVSERSKFLASHHAVTLPDALTAMALAPSADKDAVSHPALAISRLDRACVRASLRADRTVQPDDLILGTNQTASAFDPETLADRLRVRVLGQRSSVNVVAERLCLTRAEMDLRPERPDGVFLFVGPTGVGKTELAKAIGAEVFGDGSPLIRLDMSEYAHDWALSRLTGPQPGYVGSTEPESWLTTRVANAPESVILLDEIEKAHPTIWNAFLQVFDAGRLSDSRGVTADFSRSIVVMTSNLGATAFGQAELGFGSGSVRSNADAERRIITTVRESMAPELVNRLDAVVVFHPLDEEAIRQIAAKEITEVFDKLSERGFSLAIDDDALDLISENGYDPAFGARHLQRNIEQLLLQTLVGESGKALRATRSDGAIVWVPG